MWTVVVLQNRRTITHYAYFTVDMRLVVHRQFQTADGEKIDLLINVFAIIIL